MSNEIRLAFAHPSERAAATASGDPLDRISLRDHTVDVEIGAFQSERGTTQRVRFNIVVEVMDLPDPIDDDVDRILSYDKVTDAIAAELAAERLNLLETLAERIADRILLEPQAARVFVRIEKLDRGPGALGVEIVRTPDSAARAAAAKADAPAPRVVFLSDAAVRSDNLGGWLDQLEGDDVPLILCVGGTPEQPPQAGHPMAQRRIDLLAIEQNAWVLAGRDPRCVVVNSRTELEWAVKNRHISVWAPSKIVLDSVDTPDAGPEDPVALAYWFAATVDARRFWVIGAAAPDTARVPVRVVPVDNPTL